MAKKVHFISGMRNKLDKESKKILYKSLVVPSIDYCGTILFMCNEQELRTLQVLQNKVLRPVLKKNRYESVTRMLNDLYIVSNKELHTIQ